MKKNDEFAMLQKDLNFVISNIISLSYSNYKHVQNLLVLESARFFTILIEVCHRIFKVFFKCAGSKKKFQSIELE